MIPPASRRKLPAVFGSMTSLRRLNVAAVALSLAALTGAAFASMLGSGSQYGVFGVITGLPTLIFGLIWAVLLRIRQTLGKSTVRAGWLASLPLAILNGAVSGGLLIAFEQGRHGDVESIVGGFFGGAFLGATFGVIFWLPGLLATLACFGVPIAWSQKLAEKGLAGEERGERVVGVASALFAMLALVLTMWGKLPAEASSPFESIGYVLLWLFGIAGAGAGTVASALAHAREKRRKRFVEAVESGEVPGYRVDASNEGKVLVRVTSMGQGYRVANFEEEVFELDDRGEAKRSLSLEIPQR